MLNMTLACICRYIYEQKIVQNIIRELSNPIANHKRLFSYKTNIALKADGEK